MKWSMQNRHHEAFSSLQQLDPILSTVLAARRTKQSVQAIPDDIILKIFRIIADQTLLLGPSPAYWTTAYGDSSFFKAASLVCRRWYCLVSSFIVPSITVSSRSLLRLRHDKPLFRRLLRCKHLVVHDLGQDVPFYRLRRSQLPACLLACATNITLLDFELSLYSHRDLKTFLSAIASRAKRLSIHACGPAPPLDYLSLELPQNSNLKELSLDSLQLEYSDRHVAKPLMCESVILEDVEFLGDADMATVFPNAKRIVVYQLRLPSGTNRAQFLRVSKPSLKLVHFDIKCTSAYSLSCSTQDQEVGLLRSPNLRTVHIVIRKECRASYHPLTPIMGPPILPGYHMPNLISLDISVTPAGSWAFDLIAICRSLKDTRFCPRLASVPLLRIPIMTLEIRQYLEEYLDETNKACIADALASLQARGLIVQSEDMERTIWQHAGL